MTPVKHAYTQTVENASTGLTSQSTVEKEGLSSAVIEKAVSWLSNYCESAKTVSAKTVSFQTYA